MTNHSEPPSETWQGLRDAPTGMELHIERFDEALNRTDGAGSQREGATSDGILSDMSRYEQIPYDFGVGTVEPVIRDGEVVVNG